MTINEWAEEIHRNAIEHGWWEGNRSFAEIVALCHSELSEALEECRAGKDNLYYSHDGKPEGMAIEMIDCIIRILDWLKREDIDVEKALELKHEYNKTRPYKHGKKF